MEPIRQLARHWERWADSVEGLLGERLERRGEVARLAVELEESRAAHARTKLKLEAKDQAIARLEAAHAALAQEHETLRSAVAELQERHDALLRDRRYAIDHLEAALQRLRS
jgi:chromosome segregation ATPase